MSMNSPSPEQTQAAWQDAEEELAFWRSHYDELLKKYPDKFVAVFRNSVVASSSSLSNLVHQLEEKGFNSRQIWLRFIRADPDNLVL